MATTWTPYVLSGIGAPQTATREHALQLWANSEGLPDWYHNWLATLLYDTGATPPRTGFTPPYYPTASQGIAATVSTILQPNMSGIADAFRTSTTLGQLWAGINGSTWCRGCQTGRYPIQLYEAAFGPAGTTAPTLVTITTVPPHPTVNPGTGTLLSDMYASLAAWVLTITAAIYDTMLYIESAAGPLNS